MPSMSNDKTVGITFTWNDGGTIRTGVVQMFARFNGSSFDDCSAQLGRFLCDALDADADYEAVSGDLLEEVPSSIHP